MGEELWQVINDSLSNTVTTLPEDAIFVVPLYDSVGSSNYKDWVNNQDSIKYYENRTYVTPNVGGNRGLTIEFAEYLIEATTEVGDLVVDPFVGDCPIGIACMNTGRRYIGIEPDMEQADIANELLVENGIALKKARN